MNLGSISRYYDSSSRSTLALRVATLKYEGKVE